MSSRHTHESAIADLYDALLLDLDGVVYVGEQALPGAPEAIAELRRRGKAVVFITNDSRGSRADYAAKLRRLGIAATAEAVLTSSAATAAYLRERHALVDRTAFAIGSPAFKAELADVGLRLVEGDAGRAAEFVVVAWHEEFCYRELLIASQAIRRGAHFYAANRDPVFPTPDGLWPAAGAVVAAVETAAGQRAIAVGKPETPMFAVALRMLPPGARVAIVGDSLNSDILGGRRAGIGTILVLSGTTQESDLAAATLRPDHILPDLAAVVLPQEQ